MPISADAKRRPLRWRVGQNTPEGASKTDHQDPATRATSTLPPAPYLRSLAEILSRADLIITTASKLFSALFICYHLSWRNDFDHSISLAHTHRVVTVDHPVEFEPVASQVRQENPGFAFITPYFSFNPLTP